MRTMAENTKTEQPIAGVVFFPNAETCLVIDGVRNNFVNNSMCGFVTAVPGKGEYQSFSKERDSDDDQDQHTVS
jgi:hypothetical protein